MGRKKKKYKPLVFCYYCDRTFENEKVLIQHQRAKHFKCVVCHKRLGSAHGMMVHVFQVHKQQIDKVPHAKEGRDSFNIEIFGMSGVPVEVMDEKKIERGEPPMKRQKIVTQDHNNGHNHNNNGHANNNHNHNNHLAHSTQVPLIPNASLMLQNRIPSMVNPLLNPLLNMNPAFLMAQMQQNMQRNIQRNKMLARSPMSMQRMPMRMPVQPQPRMMAMPSQPMMHMPPGMPPGMVPGMRPPMPHIMPGAPQPPRMPPFVRPLPHQQQRMMARPGMPSSSSSSIPMPMPMPMPMPNMMRMPPPPMPMSNMNPTMMRPPMPMPMQPGMFPNNPLNMNNSIHHSHRQFGAGMRPMPMPIPPPSHFPGAATMNGFPRPPNVTLINTTNGRQGANALLVQQPQSVAPPQKPASNATATKTVTKKKKKQQIILYNDELVSQEEKRFMDPQYFYQNTHTAAVVAVVHTNNRNSNGVDGVNEDIDILNRAHV